MHVHPRSFPRLEDLIPDQPNFADCVAQHLPFLTRIVRGLVGGDQMAEDIVQQTLLKALTKGDQFRFASTLKTWLTSIAINEVRQAYRSRWRRRTVPLITETLDVDPRQRVEFPHYAYEAKECELLVRDAVSRLPHTYRSVLELCEFQRVPMQEAARKLGLSLPAVKSRRHRGRQKLLPLVAKLKLQSNAFV